MLERVDNGKIQEVIAQKDAEGIWNTAPIDDYTRRDSAKFKDPELIRPGVDNSGVAFVLKLRFSDDQLFIEQMKEESAFQRLWKNEGFLWKRFFVYSKYHHAKADYRACFTTTDETLEGLENQPHRLYFCKVEKNAANANSISLEWIKLRADGSVDCDQTDVVAESYPEFEIGGTDTVRDVRVLTFKSGHFLLVWEEFLGTSASARLRGYAFNVGKNGEVSNPKDWKQLGIQYTEPEHIFQDTGFGSANVVVPSSFLLAS